MAGRSDSGFPKYGMAFKTVSRGIWSLLSTLCWTSNISAFPETKLNNGNEPVSPARMSFEIGLRVVASIMGLTLGKSHTYVPDR